MGGPADDLNPGATGPETTDPTVGPTPDGLRRPRDLALLLLAADAGPPRARARDQQADRAGGALRRAVLDRVAALDPEPDDLDAALAAVAADLGAPTGPARAVGALFRREWDDARAAPGYWAWLLAEALERSSADPDRDRGRGKGTSQDDRGGPTTTGGTRGAP